MCRRLLFPVLGLVALFLLGVGLSTPAQAQEPSRTLGWSKVPYYWTLDHTAFGTVADDVGTRAFGQKAVYGSIAQLTLGANTFELGALSLGIGATGGDEANPTQIGAQFGVVPVCGPNRGICLDGTVQKELNSDGNRYLVLVLVRLGQLPEVLK